MEPTESEDLPLPMQLDAANQKANYYRGRRDALLDFEKKVQRLKTILYYSTVPLSMICAVTLSSIAVFISAVVLGGAFFASFIGGFANLRADTEEIMYFNFDEHAQQIQFKIFGISYPSDE